MTDRRGVSDALIEELAQQTGTPIESVRDLYEEEVKSLKAHAKVNNFIGVIAGKRVKRKLRGTARGVSRTRR